MDRDTQAHTNTDSDTAVRIPARAAEVLLDLAGKEREVTERIRQLQARSDRRAKPGRTR